MKVLIVYILTLSALAGSAQECDSATALPLINKTFDEMNSVDLPQGDFGYFQKTKYTYWYAENVAVKTAVEVVTVEAYKGQIRIESTHMNKYVAPQVVYVEYPTEKKLYIDLYPGGTGLDTMTQKKALKPLESGLKDSLIAGNKSGYCQVIFVPEKAHPIMKSMRYELDLKKGKIISATTYYHKDKHQYKKEKVAYLEQNYKFVPKNYMDNIANKFFSKDGSLKAAFADYQIIKN